MFYLETRSMTKYLLPGEVAAQIHSDVGTLANWRSDGRGPPYIKAGGKVLYPHDAFERWLESRTVIPATDATRPCASAPNGRDPQNGGAS